MNMTGWNALLRSTLALDRPLDPDGDQQGEWNWRGRLRRGIPTRWIYGFPAAIFTVFLATLASRRWPDHLSHQQTIPFFLAVILTSIVGGGMPSILAVILSSLALELWVPDVQPHSVGASIVAILSLGGVSLLTVLL